MDIRAYLDHQLDDYRRVLEMTGLARQVAALPASTVLADLHTVVGSRALDGEDLHRLHILLSQLYHAHPDVDGALVDELRGVITAAWQGTEEGGDVDVLLEP